MKLITAMVHLLSSTAPDQPEVLKCDLLLARLFQYMVQRSKRETDRS